MMVHQPAAKTPRRTSAVARAVVGAGAGLEAVRHRHDALRQLVGVLFVLFIGGGGGGGELVLVKGGGGGCWGWGEGRGREGRMGRHRLSP